MTQSDFGNINPDTKNGTDLAADLNAFRNALNTLHSGSARPSYVQPGMQWLNTASATSWKLNIFDGTDDILVGTFDVTNNYFKPANTRQEVIKTATYTLLVDDANVAILMNSASVTTIGLPDVTASKSELYSVRNIGTAIANIDPNGSQQIEGTTLLPLPPGAYAWIWPNAGKTAWRATVVYPENYFAKSSDDVGKVQMCAFNAIPTGTLECNGAAISRTVYSALYAKLGTAWGVGDGSTTFNLPDFRGEFLRGFDNGRGVDSGRVFGSAQTDAFKAHNHTIADPGHSHTGTAASAGAHTHNVNRTSGSGSGVVGVSVATDAGNATATGNVVISGGAHTHTLSIVADTTDITINNSGGTETRPRNKPVIFVIVY